MESDDSDYQSGLRCEQCSAEIDPTDEGQFSEHTGWYFCPECGHTNADD